MTRGYARYVLAVMVAINFLNYMDRYVGAALVTPIKKEFQLSDAQVGLLATAFLLVYAIAALPFGFWGDRGVRRTVIGVGVTIWSLATLFSGLAASYVQLFLSRAAVGVGEASYYPAGTSLVSDYFPKEQRGRVMSIWGAGSVIGIAVAYAGGGFVGGHFGWRSAFFIAAAPGLVPERWLPADCRSIQTRITLRGTGDERAHGRQRLTRTGCGGRFHDSGCRPRERRLCCGRS